MVREKTKNLKAVSPFLSVIIPCYNEEKLIGSTLERIAAYLDSKGYPYEVLAVDDGSKDSTTGIIDSFSSKNKKIRLLKNPRNMGKGYSVRRGFLEARGEYVCFTDADLSTPIEEVEKLLKWLKSGFDIAIGSRSIAGSNVEVRQKRWRELMGKTFNFLVQSIIFSGIKDTQCGFKCFSQAAAKDVFKKQLVNGFSFDVEALFIANKLGYKIKEVPIKWVNRFESRVNPIIHPLQMIKDTLKVRLRDIAGGYK